MRLVIISKCSKIFQAQRNCYFCSTVSCILEGKFSSGTGQNTDALSGIINPKVCITQAFVFCTKIVTLLNAMSIPDSSHRWLRRIVVRGCDPDLFLPMTLHRYMFPIIPSCPMDVDASSSWRSERRESELSWNP